MGMGKGGKQGSEGERPQSQQQGWVMVHARGPLGVSCWRPVCRPWVRSEHTQLGVVCGASALGRVRALMR